jgi:hypothetical protein
MRVVILAAIAALAPIASAQPGPRVVIEDDVSHDNVVKCSALRSSQVKALMDAGAKPDALLANIDAAWAAYLKSQPGFDAAKAKAEIEARANGFKSSPSFYANPAAFLEGLEKDCATFEIRSVD